MPKTKTPRKSSVTAAHFSGRTTKEEHGGGKRGRKNVTSAKTKEGIEKQRKRQRVLVGDNPSKSAGPMVKLSSSSPADKKLAKKYKKTKARAKSPARQIAKRKK